VPLDNQNGVVKHHQKSEETDNQFSTERQIEKVEVEDDQNVR
jgi:hypothetical protein